MGFTREKIPHNTCYSNSNKKKRRIKNTLNENCIFILLYIMRIEFPYIKEHRVGATGKKVPGLCCR